ncbi:armadillo-type protein [Ochromonadaceae sp. CCMP2298]|nr:armadillo-type protein [Ochromonadaceae sp. CCMP2298]
MAASRLYWNGEAEMGDIPSRLRDPLFALLRDGTLEGKAYAAMALLRGSSDSEDQQFKIAEAGGIEALNGTPDGKRTAAGGLLYAVQDAGNRHKIAETGGYEALAALLRDGTLEGKAIAAFSLLMFSFFENDQQVQIADEGVLEAFIAVLGEGVPEMHKNEKGQAALCLSVAAKNADNRVKIVEAGGIELLKALLRDGTPYGKDQAATALEELTK